MARKGWDQLSHDRRVKLEKRGLTRESYTAGAPLGERSYAIRRNEAMSRYGLTPNQVTALRKRNPQLAREHDRITRLARTNPQAAKREGQRVWQGMSADQKSERFTVTFASGDQDVVNPLAWYH